MRNVDYEEKKRKELEYFQRSNKVPRKNAIQRILNSSIINSPERNTFNYIFPKNQMKHLINHHLSNKKFEKILIAPCGAGDDYRYIKEFSDDIYGIDLSPIIIKECPSKMNCKTADILESGYPDKNFDLIASPLFFHHLVKVGFEPFLKEFHRILKPSGKLIILDFSVYYPLNAFTRVMKRIFKNPYGEVDDENPFRPKLMINSLKRSGFNNLEVTGATFSHCSFFIPLAKIVNKLTQSLLDKSPFKYFSWMILYWAEV